MANFSDGNGRLIESALSKLSQLSIPLSTNEQVDRVLLDIDSAVSLTVVPNEATPLASQPQLMSMISGAVISPVSFPFNKMVSIEGAGEVPLREVINSFGFSYKFVDGRHQEVVATVGKWQLQAIPNEVLKARGGYGLRLAKLMQFLPSTAGGIAFEHICIEAAQWKCYCEANLAFDRKFGSLLPHLKDSAAELLKVRDLRMISIPGFGVNAKQLTAEEKVMALKNLDRWTLSNLLHPNDLPWLLATWLPYDCLAVPNAQSASQDWFMKVNGGIVGFANKCYPGTHSQ